MDSAAERLALQRVIVLSAKIEAILTSKGQDVLLAVLSRARARAADALTALITVDAEDPKQIRALQNEFELFGLLVDHLREIVADGVAADDAITEATRDEYAELIITDEDRVALGIPPEGARE